MNDINLILFWYLGFLVINNNVANKNQTRATIKKNMQHTTSINMLCFHVFFIKIEQLWQVDISFGFV